MSKQRDDGWLTVDSKTLNRSQAFEKQATRLVNRETSPTSPSWMQNVNKLQRDEQTLQSFMKKSMNEGQARDGNLKSKENNRI